MENAYPLFGQSSKASPLQQSSFNIVHKNCTPLEYKFFCPENVNKIQKEIQDIIIRLTKGKYKIQRQADEDLYQVMTHIFQASARYLPEDVDAQIEALNKSVVTGVVPNIVTNIKQYLGYLKDASQMYTPLQYPASVGIRGEETEAVQQYPGI